MTEDNLKSPYTSHAYSEARYAAIMRAMIPGSNLLIERIRFLQTLEFFHRELFRKMYSTDGCNEIAAKQIARVA